MVEAYLPTASIVESIMHRAGVLGCSCISWTTCKQSARRSRQIITPSPDHSDWSILEQILVVFIITRSEEDVNVAGCLADCRLLRECSAL